MFSTPELVRFISRNLNQTQQQFKLSIDKLHFQTANGEEIPAEMFSSSYFWYTAIELLKGPKSVNQN